MTLLYGETTRDGVQTWHVPEDLPVDNPQGLPGKMAQVHPLLAQVFRQAGSEEIMLVTAISDPRSTCHACTVLIDAAIFDRVGQEWTPRAGRRGLTMAGNFGTPPPTAFRQLGPDEYGFSLTDTYGAQGGIDTKLSIYLATRRGFTLVLAMHSVAQSSPFAWGEDEERTDTVFCHQENQTIVPRRSVSHGLYDLALSIETGTRTAPIVRGAPNPCSIPISRSPDYHHYATEAVFSGTRYCQNMVFSNVRSDLEPCSGR